MILTKTDIRKNKNLKKQVKALYLEAFPEEERLPWWMLKVNAVRKDIDLDAWTDGDRFCGMTASVTAGGMHFLLFFAVAPECRSQGYGSAILSQLQSTYDKVTLNVELLDLDAPNFSQRKRRFAFYLRNGFYDTGWFVWEVGGKFRVLSTEPTLDIPSYKKIFRKLSFGFWNVKLKEEKRS